MLFCLCSSIYFLNNMVNWLDKSSWTKEFEIMQISEAKVDFKQHDYFSIGFCLRKENMRSDPYLISQFDFRAYMTQKEVTNKTLDSESFPLILQDCKIGNFKYNNEEILKNTDFEGCKCLNFSTPQPGIKLKNGENEVILRTYSDILLQQLLQFKLTIKPEILMNSTNLAGLNLYLAENDSILDVYFPDYSMKINNITHPLNIHLKKIKYLIKPYSSQVSEIKFGSLSLKDYSSIFNYDCKFIC